MEHKWGDLGFNFEPQNEQNNDENREEQNDILGFANRCKSRVFKMEQR